MKLENNILKEKINLLEDDLCLINDLKRENKKNAKSTQSRGVSKERKKKLNKDTLERV